MGDPASRYTLLQNLNSETNSDARRELLRKVTETLSQSARKPTDDEFAELDEVLSAVAKEYSVQVRTEFARLVAASVTRFCQASEQFAMDEAIEVAAPVLRHSQALTESMLLRVVREKSQAHMLAITKRPSVSEGISQALVERGSDEVVTSLLNNTCAQIADHTYDVVAQRAEGSPKLQAPFIHRSGVPIDLLNGLYEKVDKELRSEILTKFSSVSPGDLDKAFERSRARVTQSYRQVPDDFIQAQKNVAAMQAAKQLVPACLVTLLRDPRSLLGACDSRCIGVAKPTPGKSRRIPSDHFATWH